ncbi:hypothetical protein Vretimale_19074 [Volvox reticuliferus]|uniref:Uncharacterized protein n=2 Tax=Volvox reticuliferus TaxID=1737510 RepID=A0A8J4LZM1_9CHLO|nr:hypothetical protein Vretimale_19074 [Volvox reticuliferus]
MSCSSWDPLNTTQSTSDWDPLSNTCGIGTQEILADVTEDVYRNSSLGDLGHGITFDAPVDNDLGSAQGIVRPSQTDSAVGGFKSSLTGDQPELTASQSISHSNNGSPQYSFGSGYTGGESEAAGATVSDTASRVPGRDGGRRRQRAQRSAYDPIPDDVPREVIEKVIGICMDILRNKVLHGTSEDAASCSLKDQRFHMSDGTASAMHRHAASLIPTTYRAMLTMLEDMGVIDYSGDVEYDVCMCRQHVYRCEHRDSQQCPCCGAQRSQSVSYIYSGVSSLLKHFYSVPVLARDMAEWRTRRGAHDEDLIEDVTDGCAWRSIIDTDARFSNDPHHVGLSLYFDPFQLFKDNQRFLMYPFLASILNMSPHIRTRLGPSTLLCLVPGVYNKGESVNVDCILDIFVDEMLFLDTIGVDLYDAFKQESFICHARLVFFMSDYRGLQKLTRLPGTPAVMPCPRCWLAGYKYNVRGKMLYPSYGCRLPPRHHLRQKAMKLNRGNLRAMDMPARERSDLEVITGARAPMPDQHTPAPGVLDAIRRIGGPFSTKRRLAGEGTNIGDLHQVPGQTMDQTRVQPVWSETDADGMELLGGDAVSDECDSTDNEEECGPADVPNPGAPDGSRLYRLQYIRPSLTLFFDDMHVLGGIMKDLLRALFVSNPRNSAVLMQYERDANSRFLDGKPPTILSKENIGGHKDDLYLGHMNAM